MNFRHLAFAGLAAASACAHADIVGLWDFNSYTCAAPCTTLPKATQTANGGSVSALGGITFNSAAGSGTGSALSTTSYANQGTGDGTRGVQFMIDTSGYTNLVLTFDQRDSATATAYTKLMYTVDGSNWQPANTFLFPTAKVGSNPLFSTGITYDFSAITAANDNASFGIQFVATFAPGTKTYVSAGTNLSSAYGTAGTIRYDNVLLSGTAIPDVPVPQPVPEPQTYALMLAGLAAVSLIARRRRVL